MKENVELKARFFNSKIGGVYFSGLLTVGTLLGIGCSDFEQKNSQQTTTSVTDSNPSLPQPNPESRLSLRATPTPIPRPRISLEQVLKQNPTITSEFKSKVADISDGDIIENLKLYIEDGAKFRRRVVFAQEVGLGEGSFLDIASHHFLKDFLGFETSEESLLKNVEEYNLGDIVVVDDYSRPPGIILRRTPDLRIIDPNNPFTYHGDSLRIVDGPVSF